MPKMKKGGDGVAGRPSKSVAVSSGKIGKSEKEARAREEAKLKGTPAKIEPPSYLTQEQRAVFDYVTTQVVEAEILSSLDVFVLSSFAVAVTRLQQIEDMVNINPGCLTDSSLMGTRAKYQSDLWRGCNELCLSPQARAKIGSLAAQAKKAADDPLIKALAEDD